MYSYMNVCVKDGHSITPPIILRVTIHLNRSEFAEYVTYRLYSHARLICGNNKTMSPIRRESFCHRRAPPPPPNTPPTPACLCFRVEPIRREVLNWILARICDPVAWRDELRAKLFCSVRSSCARTPAYREPVSRPVLIQMTREVRWLRSSSTIKTAVL